jgi:hypothetical protein
MLDGRYDLTPNILIVATSQIVRLVDGGHIQFADDMQQNPISSQSELPSQSVEISMASSTISSNCSASPAACQTINQ